MIREILFGDRPLALLKGGLDAGSARMRAIAENLANVTTPGYQAKEVAFEEMVSEARASLPLQTTDSKHMGTPQKPAAVPEPLLRTRSGPAPPGAINNVDLEQELVRLKENEIHFQALSQMVARKYKGIEDAIR
jgi:flagellar basal-body rod protein FlgB